MGEIRVMGAAGDIRQAWNPDNADEVAAARKLFSDLTGKGHLAFQVTDKKGKKGEQVKTFDPKAGKIILAPPMAGG